MTIFPQHVLDAIANETFRHPDDPPGTMRKGQNDGPRAQLAWALEGRYEKQPHRWRGDTANHIVQSLAGVCWHTRCANEDEVLAYLARWSTQGECLGEQTPSTYDKHHLSGLAVLVSAATRDGRDRLRQEALGHLQRLANLRARCRCPPSAHPDLARRTVIAGRRCGDHRGMSAERDVMLSILAGEQPPRGLRWPIDQPEMMEVHAVVLLRASGLLPRVVGDPDGEMPVLEDNLHIQRFAHGHAAWTPVSTMRSGRGGAILWAVVADYRTGKVESVSWKVPLGLPYNDNEARATRNPRRPVARQMGGGPMPAPLPRTDHLGAKVGPETVVGDRSSTPPPPPPGPKPPPPADQIEFLTLKNGGVLPVRIRPDNLLEVIPS